MPPCRGLPSAVCFPYDGRTPAATHRDRWAHPSIALTRKPPMHFMLLRSRAPETLPDAFPPSAVDPFVIAVVVVVLAALGVALIVASVRRTDRDEHSGRDE